MWKVQPKKKRKKEKKRTETEMTAIKWRNGPFLFTTTNVWSASLPPRQRQKRPTLHSPKLECVTLQCSRVCVCVC